MQSKQNVLKVSSRTTRNLWLLQSGAPKSFTELTFKYNEGFRRRLKKQTATAELETAATCWTRAGRNFRIRLETGFGFLWRVRRMLLSAARGSSGHCWEGQRPVFVSSLPRALLLAPSTLRDIHLLSPCLPESPLSPPLDSDRVPLW